MLRAVSEMYSRASRDRDSVGHDLQKTVHRAFGKAVLAWIDRITRGAMRHKFAAWRNVMKQREMDELRAQKKYGLPRDFYVQSSCIDLSRL